MTWDVFIAHATADKDFAAEVRERASQRVFVAHLDVPKGVPWDDTIRSAQESAKTTVVLLSGISLLSPHVKDEVQRAITWKQRLLPVVLEPSARDQTRWPSGLATWQSVDGWVDDVLAVLSGASAPAAVDPTPYVLKLGESELTELARRAGVDRRHLDFRTEALLADGILQRATREDLVLALRQMKRLR